VGSSKQILAVSRAYRHNIWHFSDETRKQTVYTRDGDGGGEVVATQVVWVVVVALQVAAEHRSPLAPEAVVAAHRASRLAK
jgi:hypothetical protein